MKLFLAAFLMFSLQTAFAQVAEEAPENETEISTEVEPTETPEDQERSRTLRCNVIKTPWYLNKSFSHAKKMTSCWFPGCKLRNARKSEKYFCKAVHSCDSLNEYLESPCTADNRLTPEAREDIVGYLKLAVSEAIEFVKELLKNGRD